MRSIYWTRIISITNDCGKGHGYRIQTTRMRRTSSWRSIHLHPGQNGRCTDVIENSKVRTSRSLDTSTRAQMAKIMVQYGRPSCCSSWMKSLRPSFGRSLVGKAIRENLIKNMVGKRFRIGNACLLTEKKDYSHLCMWDEKKLAGKKQNISLTRKILM